MASIKIFLVSLLCFSVFGCSNNAEDTIVYVPVTPDPVATDSYFNLQVNGVDKHTGAPSYAWRSEDRFSIMIGKSEFSFDKNGHFGFFKYVDGQKTFYSYRDFSSHYFQFSMITVDETNKRIKGSYSGYLYANASNLNSESKFVTGIFDTEYDITVPAVANLGNKAKINGVDWKATNKYATRFYNPGWYVVSNNVSDDNYKIMVHYNQNTNLGIYNFTNSDVSNKIQLAKYDPSTGNYTNYNCSGTMSVTLRDDIVYGGTYQLTAINPNDASDVVQVTDGVFKLIYNYIDF